MNDTDDHVLVDDDGYPTEAGIQRIRSFSGTPNQLVDLLEELWWTPTLMSLDEWMNDEGKVVMRLRLATGGWKRTVVFTVSSLSSVRRFHPCEEQ